jgi:1-acyl-sn-glycerol-3-phosphate acyltransferase
LSNVTINVDDKQSSGIEALNAIRSALFFTGYAVLTITWGTLGILLGWLMPYRARFTFIISIWTGMILLWLRITCGIKCKVHGRENIPNTPCVVFAKHESTWETLFLQSLFAPQATLIKRELLNIPFFGWAFRLLRPIAIDRSSPRGALRHLISEGKERLANNIWVVLFPEGTRMPTGELGRFQPGGAALAAATEHPVLLVSHNAGRYWPAHRFSKRSGTVQVCIGVPLSTQGKSTKEINSEAHERMRQLTEQVQGLS